MGCWVSVAEAIGTLEPTSAVLLPPGAGGANAVEREIGRQADRLGGLDVYSGLLLSDYPFLQQLLHFDFKGCWSRERCPFSHSVL